MVHGDADLVVEHLVAVDVGVAEGVAAQEDRDRQEDGEMQQRPAREGRAHW